MQSNMGKYTKMVGEGHITILPWHYYAIIQGTWSFAWSSVYHWYGVFQNGSTHANGDQLDYKVYLDIGTYTLVEMGATSTGFGIMDYLIDGVSGGTADWYDSSAYNVRKAVTGIVIATAGVKTLSLKINGKNVSSSDYYHYAQSISLFRTA